MNRMVDLSHPFFGAVYQAGFFADPVSFDQLNPGIPAPDS